MCIIMRRYRLRLLDTMQNYHHSLGMEEITTKTLKEFSGILQEELDQSGSANPALWNE